MTLIINILIMRNIQQKNVLLHKNIKYESLQWKFFFLQFIDNISSSTSLSGIFINKQVLIEYSMNTIIMMNILFDEIWLIDNWRSIRILKSTFSLISFQWISTLWLQSTCKKYYWTQKIIEGYFMLKSKLYLLLVFFLL